MIYTGIHATASTNPFGSFFSFKAFPVNFAAGMKELLHMGEESWDLQNRVSSLGGELHNRSLVKGLKYFLE